MGNGVVLGGFSGAAQAATTFRIAHMCNEREETVGASAKFKEVIYGPGTGKHVVITGISQHIVKNGKFDELQRKILRQRMKNEEGIEQLLK